MAQARRGNDDYNFSTKRPIKTIRIDGKPYKVRRPKSGWGIRMAEIYEKYSDLDDEEAARKATAEEVREIRDLTLALFVDNDGTKTKPSSRQQIIKRIEDDNDDLDIEDVQGVANRMQRLWGKERPTK